MSRTSQEGSTMQAVLLAGGKGTRLRPYTHVLPKPLMPLGDADPMPIIEVVLRQLGRFGFRDVTIITGYLTELIEAFCGDGRRFGTRLSYRRETDAAGDRRRADAARTPERAGARHQRRHPDDARLRRDVRLPLPPRGGRHDRLVSPRGEDRLRRAAVRRRSPRLDRISGKARVFVRGEHGGLHPRPARLGLPDPGPAVADARPAGIDAPRWPRYPLLPPGMLLARHRPARRLRHGQRNLRVAPRRVSGQPRHQELKIGRDQ